MKKYMKIIIGLLLMIGLTSCTNNKTEFEKLFKIENLSVQSLTYQELLDLKESGIVFIGQKEHKELAQLYSDMLCECDVNIGYYVNPKLIKDDQLLSIFDITELNYPIIVAYEKGEVTGYYDAKTNPVDLSTYLHDLIRTVYPEGICTQTC